MTQNVVTYPVVVTAPNEDGKLMPGMTASLSFQIDHREKCTRVPNAALRVFPEILHVHPDDKKIVTGITDEEAVELVDQESADEKTTAAELKNRRYVWIWKEPHLRAIRVTVGIRDSKWTELVDGDLAVGDELVIGRKQKQ